MSLRLLKFSGGSVDEIVVQGKDFEVVGGRTRAFTA
jgi:hypothetical protein